MSRCPEQGLLKAYADGELHGPQRQAVQEHVARCQPCQLALGQMEKDATLVRGLLAQALAADLVAQPDPRRALDRCQREMLTNYTFWDRIRQGGERMKGSFQSTGARLAGVAAAVCLCLVALLAIEPVRLAAEDFLGVFRAERFTAVTVDVNNPPDVPEPSQLGTFTAPEAPKVIRLAPAEVQSLSNVRVAEPSYTAGLKASETFQMSEAIQYSFTFDSEKVKTYLASKGISSLVVPENLDGATIRINVPPVVMRHYYHPVDEERQRISFFQTTSPTLEVPADFDVELLRAQVLSSGLLPPELSQQLAAIQDWRSTAIIPVPSDATRYDVDIAGVPGLLVAGPKYGAGVFWQRDGVIYGLAGNLSQEETLRIARSVR